MTTAEEWAYRFWLRLIKREMRIATFWGRRVPPQIVPDTLAELRARKLFYYITDDELTPDDWRELPAMLPVIERIGFDVAVVLLNAPAPSTMQ